MRGHHVAARTPDFAIAKAWYAEKLDFRAIAEWPYATSNSPTWRRAADDGFYIEILGGGEPAPIEVRPYTDLGDSLKYRGYHHFCLNVRSVDRRSHSCGRAASPSLRNRSYSR